MSLVRAFQAFHRSNPKVYKLFKKFALDAKDWGRKRFGARFIWERMRWYIHIETRDSKFKLNDHFPPFYARKLMREVPAMRGFFELRPSAADALFPPKGKARRKKKEKKV
jgi:hypothetical protein